MASPVTRTQPLPPTPPLEQGDQLTREEFERRYDAMPQLKKAELIEGKVHMPSPVRWNQHAGPHFDLITWLGVYRIHTPGIRGGDNGSLRLDMENEPQPDAALIIEPSHGGKVQLTPDDYVLGAPELVAEVAGSSASFDLTTKLRVYRRNQVREYLVWRVLDRAVDWFVWRQGQYDRLPFTPAGHYQSEAFPGLWLDSAALARADMVTVSLVLQQGLASPEHAAFVAQLKQQFSARNP
jgi:Uma2 family endonuclease